MNTMCPHPNISVEIIVYNFGKYVAECIESVLAQTLPPTEIVITDDHSLDDSWSIISRYAQRYPDQIKAFRHEQNIGPTSNGVFGRQQTTGDFISWTDGDDRWLPRKLEREWHALQEHPKARIAYSNVQTIDPAGNPTSLWCDGSDSQPPSGDVLIEVFSRALFPNTNSVYRDPLIYREVLEYVGDCDPDLESHMDWDLKIRMAAAFPVVYTGEVLLQYRRHGEGFSHQVPLEKRIGGIITVYEKNLHLLDSRRPVDRVWVRCHTESLIALKQANLPAAQRFETYSADQVYERCQTLLDQLPPTERTKITATLAPRLGALARIAGKEALRRGQGGRSVQYWLAALTHAPAALRQRLTRNK